MKDTSEEIATKIRKAICPEGAEGLLNVNDVLVALAFVSGMTLILTRSQSSRDAFVRGVDAVIAENETRDDIPVGVNIQ